MKLKLYKAVALLHSEDKDTEILIHNPTILAKDENTARSLIIREVPSNIDLNQVEVIVRPF